MNLDIMETMFKPPFLGTACMDDSESLGMCTVEPKHHTVSSYTEPEECTCSSGQQVCPANHPGIRPSWFKTPTDNKLINLTGTTLEVDEYLVRTHADNIMKRWVVLVLDIHPFYWFGLFQCLSACSNVLVICLLKILFSPTNIWDVSVICPMHNVFCIYLY